MWTRWYPEAPSNLGHPVILWRPVSFLMCHGTSFCMFSLSHLPLIRTSIYCCPDSLHMPDTESFCSGFTQTKVSFEHSLGDTFQICLGKRTNTEKFVALPRRTPKLSLLSQEISQSCKCFTSFQNNCWMLRSHIINRWVSCPRFKLLFSQGKLKDSFSLLSVSAEYHALLLLC